MFRFVPVCAVVFSLSFLASRPGIGQEQDAATVPAKEEAAAPDEAAAAPEVAAERAETTTPAKAAADADNKLSNLPTSPDQWINSAPLPLDSLVGKGIVFYYFEEQCPKCEGRWPDILEVAERHRDEPVVFIAVNSGNSPEQLRSYLKRNKIDWPVIVDTNRSFEESSLGMEISLQNIYQTRMITAGGEWKRGNPNELDDAATTASEGGNWSIDPTSLPEELRAAWRDIEIGNYAHAARSIMRAGREGDAATKAGAKQLFDVVQGSMNTDLAAIGQQLKRNENWPAYQALESFLAKYKGYPMHPAVAEKHEQVSQMEEVRNENRAAKKLASAIRTGSRNTASSVKKAVEMLEELIDDYPDTEAAVEAKKLLEQVNGGEGEAGSSVE